MSKRKLDWDKHALAQQDTPLTDEELLRFVAALCKNQMPIIGIRNLIEMAYRRGVVQGAHYCHVNMQKHGIRQVRDWIDKKLHLEWRVQADCEEVIYPPMMK